MSNQSTKVWQLSLQLFIYSWCVFKRKQHKIFLKHTTLIWFERKSYHTLWDQDHLKFSKNSSRTEFLHSARALETDCTFLHHWSDLSLSTLHLFLLTFFICCIELCLLVDFCVNLSIVLNCYWVLELLECNSWYSESLLVVYLL